MPLFGGPNVQKLIDKRDLRKLARAVAEDDPAIREQATQGLITIADPEAVPYLVEVVRTHQQQPVIDAAVRVLSETGDSSIPVLADRMRWGDPEQRAAYGGLLGRLGERGLEPLLAASRDRDSTMRSIAAMGLGLTGSDQAGRRLAEMVHDDEELEPRSYAGFSMATHKLPGAYDALAGELDSDDASRRGLAATNLGVLGDQRAVDRIRQLAGNDPDQRVRDAAGKALSALGAGP